MTMHNNANFWLKYLVAALSHHTTLRHWPTNIMRNHIINKTLTKSQSELLHTITGDLQHRSGQIVLLTGPPGSGKSTLMHELAASDTSLLLNLQHIKDLDQLLQQLAMALDLHHEPSPSEEHTTERLTQVCTALQQRPEFTLLLDHVEHLQLPIQRICAQLINTQHSTPNLVLGSRQPLPELTIDSHHSTPKLSIDEATSLLLSLAPTQKHDQLTQSLEVIEHIVDALDTHPMSIQLCARRLNLLTPDKVLARILDNPNEYKSLQNLFQWSWDLLSQEAQHTLATSCTFNAPFDLELLAHAQNTPVKQDIIDELLQSAMLQRTHDQQHFSIPRTLLIFLREKESVQHTQQQSILNLAQYTADTCWQLFQKARGNRWRMDASLYSKAFTYIIDDIQDFWLTQLTQAPNPEHLENLAKTLLFKHLLLWKTQDFPGMKGLHQHIQHNLLEHPLVDTLPADILISLQLAHADHLYIHYQYVQAHQVVENIQLDGLGKPILLQVMLRLMEYKPDDNVAVIHPKATALAQELGDNYALADLNIGLGHSFIRQRNMTRAIQAFQENIAYCKTHTLNRPMARSLVYLGFTLHEDGQKKEGSRCIQEAYETFIKDHDIIGASHAMRIQARQYVDDLHIPKATASVQKLLSLADDHGLSWLHGFGYFLSAQLQFEQDNYSEALVFYERANYHHQQQGTIPLLAIGKLYQSICLKFLDDYSGARALFHEVEPLLEHTASPVLHLHFACEQALWLTIDKKRTPSLKALKEAHTIIDKCTEKDLLLHIAHTYEALINLTHYLNQPPKKQSDALYAKPIRILAKLHEHDPDMPTPPILSCMETRIAWKTIQQIMPPDMLSRLMVELKDPKAKALIIDHNTQSYRPPNSYSWLSLSTKNNPYNLLRLLTDHHISTPGTALSSDEIIDHLWAGEKIAHDAAQNRLYVTLSTLRSGQLKEHILNTDEGYMLSEDLVVIES